MADTLALRCADAAIALLRAGVALVPYERIRLDPVDYLMPTDALPAITVRPGNDEPDFQTIGRIQEDVGLEVRIFASGIGPDGLRAAEAIRAQAYAALMAQPQLDGTAGDLTYRGTVRDYESADLVAMTMSFSARIDHAWSDLTQ